MKPLDIIETQEAIKFIKDTFEDLLAKRLNLVRVSAPIIVSKKSGLNDHLNGYERRLSFDIKGEEVEVVQSLAKWKRDALKKYSFPFDKGLYTDMNAIRRDEVLDNLHSVYVDQWDYEKIIKKEERDLSYLFKTVNEIYEVILELASLCQKRWEFDYHLPKDIFKISSKELEELYPDKDSKEREYLITKKYQSVFIYQIGWPLKNGLPHDGRAADYDDWNLNGDIILFDEAIDAPIELSSMGIRVDKESLLKQLEYKNELAKLENKYCQDIISGNLPLTIGGGIGQSRLCMYYLQKRHIGEVQSSYWPQEERERCEKEGIKLL